MYEAEDKLFFDELYQQWSKTSGNSNTYWMPVQDEDEHLQWQLFAVDQATDERTWIGSVHSEADADFIAGLHGAIPDLIRRLHEAVDEAVRKDEANDIAQGQLADALLENQWMQARIIELENELENR